MDRRTHPGEKDLGDPSLDKYEKSEAIEELPCGIFHPNGVLMKYWSILLFLLTCYISIVMPIKIAFIEDNMAWITIDIILELLFLCDVIICCNTAYYDNNENLVTTRKQCTWRKKQDLNCFDAKEGRFESTTTYNLPILANICSTTQFKVIP